MTIHPDGTDGTSGACPRSVELISGGSTGRYEPDLLELEDVVHVDDERFEASALHPAADEPTGWVILAESRAVRPLVSPSAS